MGDGAVTKALAMDEPSPVPGSGGSTTGACAVRGVPGVRYGFRLGDVPAQARLSATNLANTFGWDVFGSGVYGFIDGRAVQFSLGVDF